MTKRTNWLNFENISMSPGSKPQRTNVICDVDIALDGTEGKVRISMELSDISSMTVAEIYQKVSDFLHRGCDPSRLAL